MPDTYITIPEEKGSINISEDVIAAIAGRAVGEVEGVSAFSNAAGAELGELIGLRCVTKGIRVGFSDDTVIVDVSVMVRFGMNITAVCEKCQKAVASAVDSQTGLKPVVNVRAAGVSFEK